MSEDRQPRALPERTLNDHPEPQQQEEQISAEEALAEARAQIESANRRVVEAEDRAREAQQARSQAEIRVNDATGAALTAQERQLEAALAAATSQADQAEATLAQAYAANDPGAIAKAQRTLSEAAARAQTLSQQKEWFAAEKARQAQEAQRAPQVQQQPGMVQVRTPGGQVQVSSATRDWMEQHNRVFEDRGYYSAAINAHNQLVEDGVRPDTPAYFRGLDDAMKEYEGYEAFRRGDQQPQPANDGLSQRQQYRRSAGVGAPPARQTAPRSDPNAPPSWQEVARHIGGEVNQDDLRQFARINGYMKNPSDEAGFARYLKDQGEIIQAQKRGEPTGLVYEQAYR